MKEIKKVSTGGEVGGKEVPSYRELKNPADFNKNDHHEEHQQQEEQHKLNKEIVKRLKKCNVHHKSHRVRQLYVCPLVSAFPGIIGPSLPCLYRIKCIIGQGSYSTVWALVDNSTEDMVVGKLSNITQESLHYVRGEATNMHLCKNFPFIVQHYKTYERHGRLLHILEYVDGGDLLLQVQARRKAMEEYKRVANDSSTPVNARAQTTIITTNSPLNRSTSDEAAAVTSNKTEHTTNNNMMIEIEANEDNVANGNFTMTNTGNETTTTTTNNNNNDNKKRANNFSVKTINKEKDNDTVSTKHAFVPITSTTVAGVNTLPEILIDENVKCNETNPQLTRRSFSFRQQKVYEKQLEKNRLKAEIDSANIKAFYFDETEILIILAQMCLALDYLHQHRIIHHDLKTSNVMVVANGLVKIGDFGFSRRYDANVEGPEAVASVCCGTPSYLAPEIWLNHRYNGKVDIWALGVIMYELMALQKPFQAVTWDQLRLQVLKSSMNGKHQVECKLSGSAYSEELISLVCSMLTFDADQRPTANEILCSPLLEHRALPLLRDHIKRLRNITDDLRANILHVVDTALDEENKEAT